MDGPEIVARSISAARIVDAYGNRWQYHSRSDRHSKVACWAVFFDLMQASELLCEHVRGRKVVFGINHTMRDFKTGRSKDLDLVIARPLGDERSSPPQTLTTLADRFGVVLSADEKSRLDSLPVAERGPVGSVLVALEAKACMAAHVKAKPRLHDELTASHMTVHGASDQAAAAAFVMINLAEEFISPDRNRHDLSSQPAVISVTKRISEVVAGVIEKVGEIPRRNGPGEPGFDAISVVVVRCRNDGSDVTVVRNPPAPQQADTFHYDQMVRRLGHIYDTRFARI